MSGQSQPDTPPATESPEESPSPKPQPTQSTPESELESQEPFEPEVVDVEDNSIQSVEDLSSITPSPSLEPSNHPNPPQDFPIFFSVENLLQTLPPSVQQISAAVGQTIQTLADSLPESVTNLGNDLTPENRKEAQQVVLVAVIVPQLAASMVRRIK